MAQVKYGSLITEMKGKIGGNVFQGGKSGAVCKKLWGYIRQAGQEYTGRFNRKKAYMALCAQHWGQLTDVQRAAWNTSAADFPATNKFGDTYTPSGYQIFCQFNIVRQLQGSAIVNTPPVPQSFPILTTLSVGTLNSGTVNFNNSVSLGENLTLEVLATASISPGRNSAPGGFKILGFFLQDETDPIAMFTPYNALFGPPKADQRINFKFRWVHIPSGVYSQWAFLKGIVS